MKFEAPLKRMPEAAQEFTEFGEKVEEKINMLTASEYSAELREQLALLDANMRRFGEAVNAI